MRFERLSWSKINSAWLCGQKFVFREIEKLERPWGVGVVRGRALHHSAQANYSQQAKTGERLSVADVQAIAAEACALEFRTTPYRIDHDYDGIGPSEIQGLVLDECVGLASEYHREIASEIVPVLIESKIVIPPSEAWPFEWVAVIDVSDTTEVIHDTKTKRKAPKKTVAEESGQASSYEMAYRAKFKKPSNGHAFDFVWRTPAKKDLKHVTQHTVRDTQDLQVFSARVAVTHKAMEAEMFLPAAADHWICSERWCEYTDVCPYFKQTERPTT